MISAKQQYEDEMMSSYANQDYLNELKYIKQMEQNQEIHELCEAAKRLARAEFVQELVHKFTPYSNENLLGWEVIQTIMEAGNGNGGR